MKTINKIRSRDPDIYDSKKEWFAGEKKEGSGGEFCSRSPSTNAHAPLQPALTVYSIPCSGVCDNMERKETFRGYSSIDA